MRIVTRARALVATVACLVIAGCSASPAEPPDPVATGTLPDVMFTAGVKPGQGALSITYELTNRSPADLVVVNRVLPDANAVFVVGRRDGRVQIGKRAFARPDDDRTDYATTPSTGGTVVGPGKSVGETFTVPLPLTRQHPYANDEIKLPEPVKNVVFCLGVLPRAAVAGTTGPDGAVVVVHDKATTTRQHLFCSPPASLS